MSAWLVCDETLNHIASIMVRGYRNNDALANEHTNISMANALKQMNLEALYQRYGDEYKESDSIVSSAMYSHATSPIQTFKHIQCFLYQCSEGDVPECLLYKKEEKLQDQVAYSIIDNLPEYNDAKWE